MVNLNIIEVTILGEINNGYRLKISVLDLGIYINGFTARKSDKNASGWWIQPPANNINGKWVHSIELDKSKSLWVEIEQACLDQLKLQEHGISDFYMPTDEEMTDESIKNSLNDVSFTDEKD